MNVGEPFLLQLGEVFDRSGVIAEEVHAADGVSIIEPVIDFGDYVVDVDNVVKSVCDVDALRIVKGEAGAITGCRRVPGCSGKGAACYFEACGADNRSHTGRR